jgi:hypothetical protein
MSRIDPDASTKSMNAQTVRWFRNSLIGRRRTPMCRRLVILVCAAVVVGFVARPAAADLEDGLVGYYRFDESGGMVAADSSPYGYDGDLSEGLEWVPGYDGGALSWPGDSTLYVQISAAGISVDAGTVAWWGYLSDPQPSQTRYFFGHTTQPAYGNRIQVYMDGATDLDVGLGGTHALDTNILPLPTAEWLHIALTWAGGRYNVYVDGEEVSNGTYSGLASLREFAWIGNDGNPETEGTEAFGGFLDEVRLYNRAVTADEIAEIVALPAEPRVIAWGPSPADGAIDVVAPLLTWNSLDSIPLHNVYFGTDPNLGPDDLAQANTEPELYFHMPGITPGQQYYWRVDEIDADMVTVHTGAVWTFIAQPYTAYLPNPADGANDASTDPNIDLTWAAGLGALEHRVYFGNTFADVNEGTAAADKGTVTDPNYAPGALAPLTTYYWRVDETDLAGTVQRGDVWSFTTYSAVDDFESYTNEVGSRPFEFWVDGIGYSLPEPGNPGNGSGAAVGHDVWSPTSPYFGGPLMETSIVNSGDQSMPVDYNNVNSPFYSEIERTWTMPQNWVAGGADALTLHVRGAPTNGGEKLYVALQDSSNRTAIVVHEDEDALKSAKWQAWTIPYSAFEGVNPAAVRKMIVGMGDRAAPVPGGAGKVYLDDFWITKPHAAE